MAHRRRVVVLALGCAAVLAALLVVSGALLIPGPALAGPSDTSPPSGCTGAVNAKVEPDVVRVCDPSAVTVGVEPSCAVCPGGLKVAFVQREIATESRWMNNEALDALATIENYYTGPLLQAAVVQYGPGRSRVAVDMTDDMDRVRSALSRSSSNVNPPDHNNAAAAAAREAVRQLQPTDEEKDGPPVCRLALFFAQDSPTPG